jgi:hypothetical protein
MRIFGFSIIRAKAMDQVHALSKQRMGQILSLMADLKSAERQISNMEQDIEALKIKCSRVNVSALENEIRRLKDEKTAIEPQKMPGDGLPPSDTCEPSVLQGALVFAPYADEDGDIAELQVEGDGLPETPE